MGYAHLQTRVHLVIDRLGKQVSVLERVEGVKDEFNNPTEGYEEVGTARCVRTYPQQNEEKRTRAGDLHADSPILLFPSGEAPDDEGRIEYPEDAESVADAERTTLYEMQAPIHYETHTEFPAERVVNE